MFDYWMVAVFHFPGIADEPGIGNLRRRRVGPDFLRIGRGATGFPLARDGLAMTAPLGFDNSYALGMRRAPRAHDILETL